VGWVALFVRGLISRSREIISLTQKLEVVPLAETSHSIHFLVVVGAFMIRWIRIYAVCFLPHESKWKTFAAGTEERHSIHEAAPCNSVLFPLHGAARL
jgi:hypothetical protein